MTSRLLGVYTGTIAPLPESGRPSAMGKRPVDGAVYIHPTGLEGDQQADLSVHGGPDKAVHLYPAGHYARLAAAFPELASKLIPGSLGENLSAEGWEETSVAVGDVFQIGGAHLQVSLPRSPCWKINDKFGEERLAEFIAREGLTGWYFRVLTPGAVAVGDAVERLERNPDPVSLASLWRVKQAHRPDPAELGRTARTPGLAADWARKLLDRLGWLEKNTAREGKDPA